MKKNKGAKASKNTRRLFLTVPILLLAACGGGGSGSGDDEIPDPVVISIVADDEIEVNRMAIVNLDASASTISTNTVLNYRWEQMSGTDVTGGAGFLTDASPAFNAPAQVETLMFRLIVSDNNSNSRTTFVKVNILEDLNTALYVDGDNADTADGSRSNPFTSISTALAHIQSNALNGYDIYVSNLDGAAGYDETGATLTVASGTSLYGGYDKQWSRDAANTPTLLDGHAQAIHFDQVDDDSWLSGFEVQSAHTTNPEDNAYVVKVGSGSAAININNNVLSAGNVATALSSSPGSSYGVIIQQVDTANITSNTIFAGDGGNGENGVRPSPAADGEDGEDASGQTHGSRGDGGASNRAGGRGGDGGSANGGNGERGLPADNRAFPTCVTGCGGSGGSGGFGAGTPGSRGTHDFGEAGGNGGTGGNGAGDIDGNGFYLADLSTGGTNGGNARGGGGGGGGEGGSSGGGRGGGGGGGGGGGAGGTGGPPGIAAGASIGIAIQSVNNARIDLNAITSDNGGTGGDGARGGDSGDGGDGGSGASGSTFGFDGGGGGGGAGGAKGGQGGPGAGGAGGPSYAIAIGSNVIATIENNVLTSGNGGDFGPNGARGLAGGQGFSGNSGAGRSGGAGGSGGTSTQTTGQGSPGISAENGYSFTMYDFDLTDATPLISGNTFNVGTSASSTGEKNW
ncbi:MAG: hypothetical protein AAF353_08730 [Pseudomonadota bacterium]